jgi:predicted esterase YcpF (UPF0227 family)
VTNFGLKMIIYLHGFASSGNSDKVVQLRERFGNDKVIAPDLPFDPDEVFKLVYDIVYGFMKSREPDEKLIFVGTSLGAFYANYFGHLYDSYAVLVNPSSQPSQTLKDKLGPNRNYFTGEEFLVSIAHLDKLDHMREYVRGIYSPSLVNLFVAKDDEVIPYESMLEAFPYATTTIMEDGGHRFTDHWHLVVDRVESLLK